MADFRYSENSGVLTVDPDGESLNALLITGPRPLAVLAGAGERPTTNDTNGQIVSLLSPPDAGAAPVV